MSLRTCLPARKVGVLLVMIGWCVLAGRLLQASGSGPIHWREQASKAQGPIRVTVRLVPVDVIVTDSKGRPVTDLKQEEFEITEDGKAQEIRHFSVNDLSIRESEPAQVPAVQPVPPLDLKPQAARIFLILMGRGRHQTPSKGVDALIRWVRNAVSPQDRLALFAFNRATNFTTDHERVAQVLERYKVDHEWIEASLESRSRGLDAIYGSRDMPKALQTRIDNIFQYDGSVASRHLPSARQGGYDNLAKTWDKAIIVLQHKLAWELGGATATPNELAAMDDATLSLQFDDFAPLAAGSMQDLQNIFTCIQYLRYMEGEKHLVYLTGEGILFPFGRVEAENGVAAAASDARVAIDTFQTGGVNVNDLNVAHLVPMDGNVYNRPETQTRWSRLFMTSSIENISSLTGGQAYIAQDIPTALSRLNEATRFEYLLGYYPDNEKWNGEYRKINVRVKRPGLKVSFRHGYYATTSFRSYDLMENLAYSRIAAAAAYESELRDIPFQISTKKGINAGGEQNMEIGLRVDASKMNFDLVDNRHCATLKVAVFYSESGGNYLGEEWENADLKLQAASYQSALRDGISLNVSIPIKAPNQVLKIVVYDPGGDKLGSKLLRTK